MGWTELFIRRPQDVRWMSMSADANSVPSEDRETGNIIQQIRVKHIRQLIDNTSGNKMCFNLKINFKNA